MGDAWINAGIMAKLEHEQTMEHREDVSPGAVFLLKSLQSTCLPLKWIFPANTHFQANSCLVEGIWDSQMEHRERLKPVIANP